MWSDPVLFTHSFLQLLSLFSTKAHFWTVPAKWYKIIWCVFHMCLCQAVIKRCAKNIVFILRFYLGSPGDANSLTLLVTQTVWLSWLGSLSVLVTQTVWLSWWRNLTLLVMQSVCPGDTVWLSWWQTFWLLVKQSDSSGDANCQTLPMTQSDSPGDTKSLTHLVTVWLAWEYKTSDSPGSRKVWLSVTLSDSPGNTNWLAWPWCHKLVFVDTWLCWVRL